MVVAGMKIKDTKLNDFHTQAQLASE